MKAAFEQIARADDATEVSIIQMPVQTRLQAVVEPGSVCYEVAYLRVVNNAGTQALRAGASHHCQGILYLFHFITIILHTLQQGIQADFLAFITLPCTFEALSQFFFSHCFYQINFIFSIYKCT